MLGLGETNEEVEQVLLIDLHAHQVDMVTIVNICNLVAIISLSIVMSHQQNLPILLKLVKLGFKNIASAL